MFMKMRIPQIRDPELPPVESLPEIYKSKVNLVVLSTEILLLSEMVTEDSAYSDFDLYKKSVSNQIV